MIEIVEEFRTRLNKALSIREMKPVDLAKKCGISESTISQYRSGYAKPKDQRLALIANALGVQPAWLMGMDVPMTEHDTNEDKTYARQLTSLENGIMQIVFKLTEENKKILLMQGKFLLHEQEQGG